MKNSFDKLSCTVKFYCEARGFGMVAPDDPSELDVDVFVGYQAVDLLHKIGSGLFVAGASVVLADVLRIEKGWVGTRIVSSNVGGDDADSEWLPATGKWFNVTTGYGFVTLDRGGEDAFLHIHTVRKCVPDFPFTDFKVLPLAVRTYAGAKGLNVLAIRIAAETANQGEIA